MAINFLNNTSSTGSITITKPTTDPLLNLYNTSNGNGSTIQFSDQTGLAQVGNITFYHADGSSQGGGASWHFVSEQDTVLVVGSSSVAGRFVAKSAGNVAEVDYGFYDDVNTGMVRTSADNVSLVAGGVAGVGVGSTAVSLKYSGSTKLATTSAGITVTGGGTFSSSVTASGNSNSFGNTTIAALSATSGTFSASVTAAGNSNSFGTTTFSGTVYIPSKLEHTGDSDTYLNFSDNTITLSAGGSSTTFAGSGTATFAGTLVSNNSGGYFRIQNAAGNSTYPTYSFQDDANTGMLSASSDSLGFITGGATALTLDSAQDATFTRDVTAGSLSTTASRTISILTAAEHNSVLKFRESTNNYGFTQQYHGTGNYFELLRHNNSSSGNTVYRVARDSNNITFYGNILLSGTGRIQGVDDVIVSTDAANKAYVDATSSAAASWPSVGAGVRTNYTLGFQPTSENYAGFYFTTSAGNGGGYLLIRGDASAGGVYTTGGITLVGDGGDLTIATRTSASNNIRFMTGASSVVRMQITGTGAFALGSSASAYGTSGQVLTSNGNATPGWTTINTGVLSVSDDGGSTINVSGSATARTVTAVTGAVNLSSANLATGTQIQTAINTALTGVLQFEGTWNANTNTPTLTSGSGTSGDYYIISVAGSTNLDGITDWQIGDWAVFANTTWTKIDNSQVGNVTGAGSSGRVSYWNSNSNITSDADFTFNGADLNLGTQAGTTAARLVLYGTTANNGPSTIKTTNGNLHIDADDSHNIYLGYYTGAHVIVGNGNGAVSGTQFNADGDVIVGDQLSITTIANATTDTNKFLVSDGGEVKYRTGAQVLSDIGGAPATGGAYLPLAGGTMSGNITMGDNDITGIDELLWSSGTKIGDDGPGLLKLTYSSTTGGGIIVYDGDNTRQGYLYADGFTTSSFGLLDGTGSWAVRCLEDQYVELRYDNDVKLRTATGGVTVTGQLAVSNGIEMTAGNFNAGDGEKIRLGDSADLQIFHDGSNSYVETTSASAGDFYIKALGTNHDLYLQAADDIFIRPKNGENGIKVLSDDSVELYFNNVRKLRTTSTGINVEGNGVFSGTLTVEGNSFLGNAMSDKAIVHGHLGLGEELYPKIAYPGQNALWSGNGTTTGQVVIDLPGTLSNYDMTYMEIDIYEYNAQGATKLIIGGHNWNSGGNSNTSSAMWHNVNVQVIGALDKPIYFGRRNDGTSERRCIAIGETNSSWVYATVQVHKVHGAEFYGSAIDWVGDWDINQTTSTSYFTKNPGTNFNSGTTLETNGNVGASSFTGDHRGTINTATTGTTQSAGNNSTKIATTAFVTTAVASAGVGTFLPLAGGTLTGGLVGLYSKFTQGVYDDTDGLRILNPGGGSESNQTSVSTGAIKITLPQSWTNNMLRMTIKVYEYSADKSFTVNCGGYNHTGAGGYWVNTFAYIESSSFKDRNFNVRFGHDGSKCCIFIGELTSTWSYAQVFVTDFQSGYSGLTASNWRSGWNVGFEASSFGTISATESNPQVNNWARSGSDMYFGSTSGNVLVTTQGAGDNSTKAASTAFVTTAVAAVPIGNYLPLAGGTMANTNVVVNMNADLLDGHHASLTRNSANTIPIRDVNGYLNLGWINTTSGVTTATINKIYVSNDDYIRYITPATFRSQVIDGSYLPVANPAFTGTLTGPAATITTVTGNLVGNASTSTTFSTGRTNYKGVTDAAVTGMMMWKNYGNNHTIFDASAGTSPSGSSINNTNSATAWTATYPTLMGWNGSGTYGVRVDSARLADSATAVGGLTSSMIVSGGSARKSTQVSSFAGASEVTGAYFGNNVSGAPTTDWINYINSAGNSWASGNNYAMQLTHAFHSDNLWVSRTTNGTNSTARLVIDSGNIGTQTVANATNALPLAGGTMSNTNLVTNMNADLLDGQQGSYYLDYANFTGTPSIPSVGNGTFTVSGSNGITGSGSMTANQSGTSSAGLQVDSTVIRTTGGQTISDAKVFKGSIQFPASGLSQYSRGSLSYAIYQESGSWSSPFPDLNIAMHTGISIGAHANYNGMRFFNDSNMSTQVMSINNGSDGLGANNVYINNGLQVNGGNITLGGISGRIQGVVSVLSNTDAASKGYVDSAVGGVSSGVTSVATGGGLDGGTITTTGTIEVEYDGVSTNIIQSGFDFTGDTVVSGDYIMISDPGATSTYRRVGYVTVSDLPFASSSVVSGVTSVATGSGISGGTITSTGTIQVDSTVIRNTGTQTITGNTSFAPSSTSTGYGTAAIELRESNQSGSSGTPPRISWHHGGVAASSMTIESNGTIAVRNNPGTAYEQFACGNLKAHGGTFVLGSGGTGDMYLGNQATGKYFRFHTNNNQTYFDMNCSTINWREGSSTRYYFYPSTANMTINGTLTQNSDARVKENVVEIDNCISKVQAMKGVYYNRTDFNTDVTKVGVIAQDVEAVLPELILEAPDTGLKSVAYAELTAVLINAIKEQQEIIEDLKTRVQQLEK